MTKSTGNPPPVNQAVRGIRGIGPARQQWLQDTLNIVTIQDLATASWESIEYEVGQDDGIIIPRREIQSWINQARSQLPQSIQSEITEEVTLIELDPIEELIEMIPEEPIVIAPSAIVIPDLSLTITQVQILQSGSHLTLNAITLNESPKVPLLWLHRNFEIEVQFELDFGTDLDAEMKAAIDTTYNIQCHAQNRVTGWMVSVEMPLPIPLISEQSRYDSRLFDFQLDLGIYRLQIWVTIQGIRSVGYFDIPLIQIT